MLPFLPSRLNWHLLGYGAAAILVAALTTRLADSGRTVDTLTTSMTQKSQQVTSLQTALSESEQKVTAATASVHERTVTTRKPDGTTTTTRVRDSESSTRSSQSTELVQESRTKTAISTQTASTSTQTHEAGGGLPSYSLGLSWAPMALSALPGGVPMAAEGAARLGSLPVWATLQVSREGLRATMVGIRLDF